MERCKAKVISEGLCLGKIYVYKKPTQKIDKTSGGDKEIDRYNQATKEAVLQLQKLAEKALLEMGEDSAKIFGSHQMVLEDEGYRNSVYALLEEEQISAEYAVMLATDEIAKRFDSLEDDYMKARAGDIRDISGRLLSILSSQDGKNAEEAEIPALKEPCILFAEELYPAQIVQMNHGNLKGIVTKKGSEYSHTAILARTLGIPAFIGVDMDEACHGKMGILDTEEGILVIEPDEQALHDYYEKEKIHKAKRQELQNLKGMRIVTKSGRPLTLLANVGEPKDIERALEYDAEGIGLFRTEFLFMEKGKIPTEEEQYEIYQKAAKAMFGKPVIIRTLDVGEDKQIPDLFPDKEESGCRGVAFCLRHKELFKCQLRAIFRAAFFGDVRILYPMISSLEEISALEKLLEEVEQELVREGKTFRSPSEGFMVETPQAVQICEQLAQKADFFSIGTNDLLRYIKDCKQSKCCPEEEKESCYEAMLPWIEKVINAARNAGIMVGICGEMGADPKWTKYFMEWGVDSLSMSANRILQMRKHCCDMQNALSL